jgi:enoyl-CoA hydratase/carnithine racemase
MRAFADVLSQIDETIAATYAARASVSKEEALKMMDEEKWMTGAEAHDLGFVDEVKKISKKTPENMLFDLSVFNKVPSELKQKIENGLRDAGYSRREAKAAVSLGFSVLDQCEADKDNVPDLCDAGEETKRLLASIEKLSDDLKSCINT